MNVLIFLLSIGTLEGSKMNPPVEAVKYTEMRKCCPVVGTRLTPFCDTNGITYFTEDEYTCIAKIYEYFGQVLKKWPCGNLIPDTEYLGINHFAECHAHCNCDPSAEICASNNIKYPNPCHFDCVKKYYDAHSGNLDQEPCKAHSYNPTCEDCCQCTEHDKPICTNGKVYKNLCYFDCALLYFKSRGIKIFRQPCGEGFGTQPVPTAPAESPGGPGNERLIYHIKVNGTDDNTLHISKAEGPFGALVYA